MLKETKINKNKDIKPKKLKNKSIYNTLNSIPTKNQRRLAKVYIQAGYHNTIITITNINGDVICSSSAGTCGFKGKRKSTPLAAKRAAEVVTKKAIYYNIKEVQILVSGPGIGRESAIREIFKSGIYVSIIRDKTGIPHNGCRPPKKRRI